MNEWYVIDDVDQLDSPALVVFPERVGENIATALAMVGDPARLRPHVKTSKCSEAVLLMLAAGVTKFKCATIAEAEMLGICGAPDVLLAYQPTGPKLRRFIAVIKQYPGTKYSCLVDNIVAAQQMAMVFDEASLTVPVFVDVNVGMNRTGIAPGQALVHLYMACGKLAGIRPIGLHAYDGHIRDSDFPIRKQRCDEAYETVKHMEADIEAHGFSKLIVVMGGSPSFSVHSKRSDVECSPGTFVYWDKGYADLCPEQNFKPAALVISRIISLPATGTVCTDLGHKSIAAENEITRRVFFVNGSTLRPLSHSEEHFVLAAPHDHLYRTGDLLYGIPFHVCPTVALYERAITIENGKITGEWQTVARDRRITA